MKLDLLIKESKNSADRRQDHQQFTRRTYMGGVSFTQLFGG